MYHCKQTATHTVHSTYRDSVPLDIYLIAELWDKPLNFSGCSMEYDNETGVTLLLLHWSYHSLALSH